MRCKSSPSELPELCVRFIASASNAHTQRARQTDLNVFAQTMNEGNNVSVNTYFWNSFFILPQGEAAASLLDYQSQLLEKGLSETTVNRRLASLRALLRFARTQGTTHIESDDMIGTFPSPTINVIELLSEDERLHLCATPLQGNLRIARGVHRLRDAALLSLLCEVPLQGSEVGVLRIADFPFRQRWLNLSRVTSLQTGHVQLSPAIAMLNGESAATH